MLCDSLVLELPVWPERVTETMAEKVVVYKTMDAQPSAA